MKTRGTGNGRTTRSTPRATRSTGTKTVTSMRTASFTVPTLSAQTGAKVADQLQRRLVSLADLALTLKHIHWNVVGPNFIAVHQMLDPQYDGVQKMVDELAERIATLGSVPVGLPGCIVETREWTDYELARADSIAHLGALDLVYQGVISSHRKAMDAVEKSDQVSFDLLVGQTAILEKYHWFVRSHLADWAGGMANAGARTELGAAQAVAAKQSRQQHTTSRKERS
jgi:starvation-inducible DNA-binding protein